MKKKPIIAILVCLILLAIVGGGIWYTNHRPGTKLVSRVLCRDYGEGVWEVLDHYEYDNAGNLLRHVSNRSNVDTHEYEYDELGRQISETIESYSYRTKDEVRRYKYAYEYDDDGNLIKKAEVGDDGSFKYWREYSYDAIGNKVRETTYKNIDGTPVRQSLEEYEYDDAGNQTKYVKYWPEDTIKAWKEYIYEYDAMGNMVKKLGYDHEGNILDWRKFEYDASGNMIKETWYNIYGDVSSWSQYTYGEFGILTEERYRTYGSDDGFTSEMKYPEGSLELRTEYEYDSSGVLRKQSVYHSQSYDYAGHWEDYTYDSDGNLLYVKYWEGNSRGDRSQAYIRHETKYQYIVIDKQE